jgi:hypothetical protein
MDPQPSARRPRGIIREALPAVARSIRWLPLGIAVLLSGSIVALRSGEPAAGPMQAVALLLACGAGFALDDPAAEVLAASPTPLSRRRSLRLLLVLPPLTLFWVLLLRWQETEGSEETMALMLVFAGLVGLSLAIAGVAGRTSWLPSGGGVAVSPAILFLMFLSSAIPRRWRPLPLGDVPGGWAQIYIRWAGAAAVATLALLMSSRDPAARRLRRTFDRRSGPGLNEGDPRRGRTLTTRNRMAAANPRRSLLDIRSQDAESVKARFDS